MNWLTTVLFTILFYSVFDLFVKLASGKINDNLGATIMNMVAFLVTLIWLVIRNYSGEHLSFTKPGIIYAVLAGIFVGLASIFFIRMFALGINLSVGVPLVRVGMIVLGSFFGVLILKDGINLKYIVGFLFSVIGLYLIITAK